MTWDVRYVTATTRIAVPVLAVVAVLAWLVSRRPVPDWARRGAVALLVGAVLVEVTMSSVAIDVARGKILSAADPWGQEHDEIRSLVQSADDWPQQRSAPGAAMTVNDPMLIGGQGPQYYSSTIPDAISKELIGLGFGYSSYGRATLDPQNPVVDAAFSVGARVVVDKDSDTGDGDAPRLVKNEYVAPLVTVRPVNAWASSDPRRSVCRRPRSGPTSTPFPSSGPGTFPGSASPTGRGVCCSLRTQGPRIRSKRDSSRRAGLARRSISRRRPSSVTCWSTGPIGRRTWT